MKSKHLGSYVRVSVSAREVEAFNRSFPCSEVPERACWFEFAAKSGDLADMSPHLMEIDGAALAALADEAKRNAVLPVFPHA